MTSKDIAFQRLINQRITGSEFSKSQDVVSWMGCIQAQDFAGGKWAIGIRGSNISDADITRDFNTGNILRTHILRPTWHFVSPADIRWMLRLTAPKIKAFNRGLHQRLGIDDKVLRRSKNIIEKSLAGGEQLTRQQLVSLLKRGRVDTDDLRASFLIMDAELDGIVCSGAMHGKQFTYTLLPPIIDHADFDRDEAIAELTYRYFSSRGPATLRDFSWWSGMNLSDARKGIGLNKQRLAYEVLDGEAYWFSSAMPVRQISDGPAPRSIYLLPAFDEYAIGYKDRSAILGPDRHNQSVNGLRPVIIMNGQVAGTWKRTWQTGKVVIETFPFTALGKIPGRRMKIAGENYAEFANKRLVPGKLS
jgi:hypothetical protein